MSKTNETIPGRPASTEKKLPAGLAVSDWLAIYSDGRVRGVCAGSLSAALLALGDKAKTPTIMGLVRREVLETSSVIQAGACELSAWKCFRIVQDL